MGEMGEWASDIQVIVDKVMIEVSETEEGLDVFDLPQFGPFSNDFDLVFGHHQAFSIQDVAKEFYQILVPFTFVCFSEEAVFPKSLKYLLDVFHMLNWIIRVDQNFIKINDDTDQVNLQG